METVVAVLKLHLHLAACTSLKEKRGRIKPLIARLHREFNISVAETDLQDRWQEAVISCAMVSTEGAHLQQALQTVGKWVAAHWPDGHVIEERIELVA